MSKIEEMIKRLCPNGVERVPVWRYTAWDKKFNAVDKSMQKSINKYKYLLAKDLEEIKDNSGDIRILYTTEEIAYTTEEKAGNYISEGEVIAIPWGGTPSVKYYKGRFITGDNRIATSIDAEKLSNKYLYYVLLDNMNTISKFYRGAGIKHPSMFSILTLEIPLPPLCIQREIISVLDSFTTLIDKMKQEVKLRKKQIEYYREKLLSFDEEIRKLSFGKDFTLKARIGWQGLTKKEYLPDGEYKLITGTDFTTNNTIDFDHCVYVSKERYEQDPYIQIKEDDVLITKDGTLGKIAYISELPIPATLNGGVFVVRGKTGEVTQRFLKHYLISNNFKNWIEQNHTAGSIMHLTQKLLEKFNIPVPSPSTQEDIVSTLDAFEQYISKLERLITLREKQYAYYREKLLTFE